MRMITQLAILATGGILYLATDLMLAYEPPELEPAPVIQPMQSSPRPLPRPALRDTAAAQCLAAMVYHEARGESIRGQLAVAEVVINRVVAEQWPDTVCGVVQDPGQFSSAIGTNPDEAGSWAVAEVVAVAVLSGRAPDLVPGAVMFHSGADPYWADDFQLVAVIDGHKFYR